MTFSKAKDMFISCIEEIKIMYSPSLVHTKAKAKLTFKALNFCLPKKTIIHDPSKDTMEYFKIALPSQMDVFYTHMLPLDTNRPTRCTIEIEEIRNQIIEAILYHLLKKSNLLKPHCELKDCVTISLSEASVNFKISY